MAGVTRKTSILFGGNGPTTAFGVFASKELGVQQTSQDPAVIQSLSAGWQQGWQAAVVSGDKAAYLQDQNGFCYVDSWQITYILQMGIPEYDASTLYFTGSIVQTRSNGQQFQSLQGGVPGSGAGQSGNTPPTGISNSFWQWINPPQDIVGSAATLNTLPMVGNTAPGQGPTGSVALSDSPVSYVSPNIVLSSPATGLKFPDGTVQTTAAASSNAVTVQSPPTGYVGPGTRAIGTIYQNTGSKPRFVTVSINLPGGTFGSTVYCDSSATPSTVVAVVQTGSSASLYAMTFIVLPSYYYQVNGGTKIAWIEWT